MPGSGKSTIGKMVADQVGLKFIDLDVAIEEREQNSIADIFTKRGEDYFRKVESEVLHSWLVKGEDYIMATGGGTPCFFDNMAHLNRRGTTIYLKAPASILLKRTKKATTRPLLKDNHDKQLKELLIDRELDYQKAKFTISIQDSTPQEVTDKIVGILNRN